MCYRVYKRRDVLNSGINLRGEERVFALFFTMGHFSFGVVYKPNYFTSSDTSHFDFYALSMGFEGFTETGYRSCFLHNSKKVASYDEIKDYFMELLKGKVAFLDDKPVQLGLF